MPAEESYWLVKSEPQCFSIQHLAQAARQTTCWSGVRNYQARNFMRDGMKLGDGVLYYHSSVEPPAVVGTAKVVREAYADHTALDKHDDHFDPKATRQNPIWMMVDLQLDEIFPRELPLEELRGLPVLKDMELLKRGSRLSVQPVSKAEFAAIIELAHATGPSNAGSTAKTATVKKATSKNASKAPAVKRITAKPSTATVYKKAARAL